MRRSMGIVLFGLGGLLLAVAVLALTWAPGVVKKTPLDVDTTTIYEGQAAKLDPATGAFDTKPAYAIRHTKADSDKSNDDTVLMVETACAVFDTGGAKECVNGNDPDLITASIEHLRHGPRLGQGGRQQEPVPTTPSPFDTGGAHECVNGNDPDLITAAIDIFAEDRVTAEAVDDKNLPADAVPHEGLVNKFPFDVEKKTYCLWDGDVGHCVDIDYKGTKTLFGLSTYEFSYTVKDVPIQIGEGIAGTYDNVVTVNVDPKTGSIVKSGQDQQQFLEDGTPGADVQLTQTDDSVKEAVDEAKTAGTMLTILLTVVPIVGFVGGVLCLVGGFLLCCARRRGAVGEWQSQGTGRRRSLRSTAAPSPRRRSRCPG